MSKLSKVLSEAITQAVNDTKLVLKDNDYILDFDNWHEPKQGIVGQFEEKSKCSVCFAGAVISKSLGGDIKKPLRPDDFPESSNMLRALDKIRQENILQAFMVLEIDMPQEISSYIEVNQRDKESFFKSMEAIVQLLQKHNL